MEETNNQNKQQEQEEKNSGFSTWIYIALACFVFFFVRNCGGCSGKSDSGHRKTNNSEMVHKGLYDEGFKMGYASSHGIPMSVGQAYDIWSEKVIGAPDNPTPEFVQGFYDGQAQK